MPTVMSTDGDIPLSEYCSTDSDEDTFAIDPTFTFTEEDPFEDTEGWNDIKKYIKRAASTLDEKISQIREERRKKKSQSCEEDPHSNIPDEEGESEEEQEPPSFTDEQGQEDDALSDEAESDDPGDIIKLKKRTNKAMNKENNTDDIDVIGEGLTYDRTKTFLQMNLSRPLQKAVTNMNFLHPTPIQQATIPSALMGRDIYGCAATGTGKTAAFMLPVLERLIFRAKGKPVTRVLVLLPTRELAVQVYQVAKQLAQFTRVQIALSAGGLDIKAQEVALRQIPDIVIATPGRLIDHLENTPSFSLQNIEILILDEADRILDEYFAEQMKKIIKDCSFTRQVMLFSATLSKEVKDLAGEVLKQPVKIFVSSNTEVTCNLHQEFIRIRTKREADREAILAALLLRTFEKRVIVFVQTKKQVHRLHILLGLLGIKTVELQGNLTQAQRLEALTKFKDEEVDIMIATDVAARGLDIVSVKTVLNFTLPCTLQHYIHRVGRTARAGRSGRSVSLVGEQERKLLKEIVKQAKVPVKHRIIASGVVEKFKKKLDELEDDLSKIMRQEKEDKELKSLEKDVLKAETFMSGKTVENPVKRAWFQTVSEKIKEKNALRLGDRKTHKDRHNGKPTTENRISVELQKAMQYQVRIAKKVRKPKRMRTLTEEEENRKPKHARRGANFSKKSFDDALVNTSRKAVRQFRHEAKSFEKMERIKKTKAKGKFKSKTRYRRKK